MAFMLTVHVSSLRVSDVYFDGETSFTFFPVNYVAGSKSYLHNEITARRHHGVWLCTDISPDNGLVLSRAEMASMAEQGGVWLTEIFYSHKTDLFSTLRERQVSPTQLLAAEKRAMAAEATQNWLDTLSKRKVYHG